MDTPAAPDLKMPGPAGPRYAPGVRLTGEAEVTVPKGTALTLDHLRALVADAAALDGGSLVTYKTRISGKLSELRVKGPVTPAANTPLTG